MNLKSLFAAVAIAACLVFSPLPSQAQSVQKAVEEFNATLLALIHALNYSPEASDTIGGFANYVGKAEETLPTNDYYDFFSNVTTEYITQTSLPQRQSALSSVITNIVEITEGTGKAQELRDNFYLNFVGNVLSTWREDTWKSQLTSLFGEQYATSILAQYRDAVSRNR